MPVDPAAQLYQGASGQDYHVGKRGVPAVALPWIARLRARKLAADIRPTDTVLEYGVGAGWNLAALHCARRLGYDVAEILAPGVRELGIEFLTDLDHVPPGCMDAVLCHHTLEHVLAPVEVLRRIQSLLRPGGRLLLYAPFENEWRHRHFNPEEPNHHLYSWNVQTLANLVILVGYELRQAGLGRYGYDRRAAQWAVKCRLGEGGFRLLRGLWVRIRPLWEVKIVAEKAGNPAFDAPATP